MKNKKITSNEVGNIVKQFADADEKNVVFGFVGNTKNPEFNVFIKGTGADLIASICAQMSSDKNFKDLMVMSVMIWGRAKDKIKDALNEN